MNNLYQLPDIPYPYDALEPYIDVETMNIHHNKHHAAYVEKLNAAISQIADFAEKPIENVLKDLDQIPESVRSVVRNHGGGHANHSFFWQILAPADSTKLDGDLAAAITREFGELESFKEQFTAVALNQFGSGWTWLCLDINQKLSIIPTSNQDSPLSQNFTPILNLDVWEHAYYLKYQNRRAEYIENWWQIVNWSKVNQLYKINT